MKRRKTLKEMEKIIEPFSKKALKRKQINEEWKREESYNTKILK